MVKDLKLPTMTPLDPETMKEIRCRNNWHIHHKQVQVLICVAGRGWYQEWGKEAVEMTPGTVIAIPAEVKHWHGAAKDSWFQHLTYHKDVQEGASNEWCEPVTEEEYRYVPYGRMPDAKTAAKTPILIDVINAGMEEKGICFSVQAPSKVPCAPHGAARMHAMSNREVKKLIQDFIDAAERCKKAGVDAVELHGAHGYLIQQFLSPYTNHRTDEYGGSFENRMRFLEEIVTGIKQRCGKDYPLIVRLTVDEMYDRIGKPGTGYDLETGKRIAKRLEQLGVDAINVSSACYDVYNCWLEPTTYEPGWRK